MVRVALLAEGVGRNFAPLTCANRWAVALLAEGVGRNCMIVVTSRLMSPSPSSRRAWVEI